MAADRSAPVTVRLFPMTEEHTLPFLVDIVFFFVVFLVWAIAGGPVNFGSVFVMLVLAVLVHLAQMRWLVADRFDDRGVTLIRTWRRRHVPWSQVSGLVYTHQVVPARSNWTRTRAPYRLRLVLKDNEPPIGRYLTKGELEKYATGPILLAMGDPADDWKLDRDDRQLRCANRVYAELERHGFPSRRRAS